MAGSNRCGDRCLPGHGGAGELASVRDGGVLSPARVLVRVVLGGRGGAVGTPGLRSRGHRDHRGGFRIVRGSRRRRARERPCGGHPHDGMRAGSRSRRLPERCATSAWCSTLRGSGTWSTTRSVARSSRCVSSARAVAARGSRSASVHDDTRRARASASPATNRATAIRRSASPIVLVRAGLPRPVLGHRLDVGQKSIRLDIAYVDARFGYEYDSYGSMQVHFAFENDRERDLELELIDWRAPRRRRRRVTRSRRPRAQTSRARRVVAPPRTTRQFGPRIGTSSAGCSGRAGGGQSK